MALLKFKQERRREKKRLRERGEEIKLFCREDEGRGFVLHFGELFADLTQLCEVEEIVG